MSKRALIFLLLAFGLVNSAFAAEIYRWRDSNGQVHFSDMPKEGAEKIIIDQPQVFSGRSEQSSSPPRQRNEPAKEPEPDSGYEALRIFSPSEGESVWNTGGVITVSVSPTPPLKPGHILNIYFDNRLVSNETQTSVQLSSVSRGTHSVRAEIRDPTGAVPIRARPVTFFYRQNSKLTSPAFKNSNANAPPPANNAPPVTPGNRRILSN